MRVDKSCWCDNDRCTLLHMKAESVRGMIEEAMKIAAKMERERCAQVVDKFCVDQCEEHLRDGLVGLIIREGK